MLVVLPGLSFEWIIWCIERSLQFKEEGYDVTFLDLSEFNPIRYRRFLRKLIHRIRYRNCIHSMLRKITLDIGINYVKPKNVPLYEFNDLDPEEVRTFMSALDAVYGQQIGKRILFESDLPIRTVAFEKKLFIAAINQVVRLATLIDANELTTVNGRCLTDSAVLVAAKRINTKVFRLEAGGGASLNHEIYASSHFDVDLLYEIILDTWNHAEENKHEIAESFLENKLLGYLGENPYWSLSFKYSFNLDSIGNRKIAVFFPTTDFEYPLFDSAASARTYGGNQVRAFELFSLSAKKNGYQVVVRVHPHPFDKVKEESDDAIWKDACTRFDAIFLRSQGGVDSKSLLEVSSLNCVYESSIAIESICLKRPTIIMGRTEFDNFVPELCAFDSNQLDKLIELGPPIIDPIRLHAWAYYKIKGGLRTRLFMKFGHSFFYNETELEFNRLRRTRKASM